LRPGLSALSSAELCVQYSFVGTLSSVEIRLSQPVEAAPSAVEFCVSQSFETTSSIVARVERSRARRLPRINARLVGQCDLLARRFCVASVLPRQEIAGNNNVSERESVHQRISLSMVLVLMIPLLLRIALRIFSNLFKLKIMFKAKNCHTVMTWVYLGWTLP